MIVNFLISDDPADVQGVVKSWNTQTGQELNTRQYRYLNHKYE